MFELLLLCIRFVFTYILYAKLFVSYLCVQIVTILNDLGTVYDLKGDYDKAKDSIRRSAQLAQRLGNDQSLPTIVCNLASVEAHTGMGIL